MRGLGLKKGLSSSFDSIIELNYTMKRELDKGKKERINNKISILEELGFKISKDNGKLIAYKRIFGNRDRYDFSEGISYECLDTVYPRYNYILNINVKTGKVIILKESTEKGLEKTKILEQTMKSNWKEIKTREEVSKYIKSSVVRIENKYNNDIYSPDDYKKYVYFDLNKILNKKDDN